MASDEEETVIPGNGEENDFKSLKVLGYAPGNTFKAGDILTIVEDNTETEIVDFILKSPNGVKKTDDNKIEILGFSSGDSYNFSFTIEKEGFHNLVFNETCEKRELLVNGIISNNTYKTYKNYSLTFSENDNSPILNSADIALNNSINQVSLAEGSLIIKETGNINLSFYDKNGYYKSIDIPINAESKTFSITLEGYNNKLGKYKVIAKDSSTDEVLDNVTLQIDIEQKSNIDNTENIVEFLDSVPYVISASCPTYETAFYETIPEYRKLECAFNKQSISKNSIVDLQFKEIGEEDSFYADFIASKGNYYSISEDFHTLTVSHGGHINLIVSKKYFEDYNLDLFIESDISDINERLNILEDKLNAINEIKAWKDEISPFFKKVDANFN